MTDALAQLSRSLTGRYAIEREIGAGGMATVYLARDVKHNRRVALKVLKPELGAVLGVERFLAEIQVTANLQHPNLLPLFDSGEAEGLLFYVMPYVEGESLRARLDREKQLPVDEAVHIAVAVASALDYAHGHGVIHRDLKPENILLQASQPVVADFGIALAVTKAGGARITQTGLSLGTPQYMSPEQATGDRAVDGRTDIYSLAAVTYEMLAGEPPHAGPTAQAIIAKLMTEEVRPLTVLRHAVPPHVDFAVRHALEKLPADRFATAHEFADALQGRAAVPQRAAAREVAPGTGETATALEARLRRLRWTVVGLAAACGVVGALAVWQYAAGRRGEPEAAVQFILNFEPNERLADNVGSPFALSPDGRLIAYVAIRASGAPKIYVRSLGDVKARELPGTEGAFEPKFSPDGRWLAFAVGRQIKKVSVDGGAPVLLGTIPSGSARGMSWGTTGEIVVGQVDGGLVVVRDAGGAPEQRIVFSSPDRAVSRRWPLVLRDGKTVIFVNAGAGQIFGSSLWIGSLSDGISKTLDLQGTAPLGVVDGQLLYVNTAGAVVSVAFDAARLKVTGTSIPVVSQITTDATSGAAKAAMSSSADLIYQSGFSALELVLADAHGLVQPLFPELHAYSFPRFSPDGRKIAVSLSSASGNDIWILDRSARTLARLTAGESVSNERPEWSPDGKRVLFRSSTPEGATLWWQPSDRSGPAELLARVANINLNEGVISPDGRTLLVRVSGGKVSQDIWYRQVTGDTAMKHFLTSPAYETGSRFSPDGRWVAYSSDESLTRQVYVTPFPGPGPRVQVSIEGGDEPLWSHDGRRLYYVHDRKLVAASVTLSPAFTTTGRETLFEGNFVFNYIHANYDVSPDGKQFLLLKASADAQTIVVHNWRAELQRRRQGARAQ